MYVVNGVFPKDFEPRPLKKNYKCFSPCNCEFQISKLFYQSKQNKQRLIKISGISRTLYDLGRCEYKNHGES